MATLEEIMLGLKSQEGDNFADLLGPAISPEITKRIPGIENIILGQAPIVSQEGIQYQTPESGGDTMSAKESISAAWKESVLGQKMKGAFGQQVFGVGNDQYQIRNKFLGTVGSQIPYSEASPQAKSEAMRAYFLGGITERPVGQTYEQAVAQKEERVTPALESVVTTTPDLGSEVAANTVMEAPGPSSEQIELAQPRLTTVGGASLSEFLGGAAMPEQGFARAERQMAGRGITLTPEQFNELSAQREARIGGGGGTATERDTRRAEDRVTSSQNIPRDVREAMNTPAGRLTRDQIKRLSDWQGSTQGQAYIAEQEAAEAEAEAEANKPFEPKEVEIGGNKYIQFGPKDYRRVEEETPTEPKKSEIESIREEGVKAGLPENLIRQSIASKLGLDLFNEEVMNWIAGNTDTIPSVEGASESSAPSGDTESSDVLMIGTDGKTRKVPAKDKEAALKAGYTLK